MESVEVSVRLDPTTDHDAKEAYEQLILTFSHYGLSPDAQDAVWRSAVRFTTYLLLKHGEIPSLEGAGEDTPLRMSFRLASSNFRWNFLEQMQTVGIDQGQSHAYSDG